MPHLHWRAIQDSSRMRGGQPLQLQSSKICSQFSPHVRGSTRQRQHANSKGRILPACAGVNLVSFHSLAGVLYSPRMRGGQPSFMATLDRPEEFSPACAGVNPPNNRHSLVLVILPACAGVNPTGHKVYSRVSYSPRMRGGQPRTPSPFEGDIGFSPHARGSP